ncbi:hypothetical protein SUGI_0349910 [Cryptomeria japonica]|uniref:uncharacterized protein LOC131077888 n=1 Tax=Cryptomeria japonica TaxID=3369 RepID=UPI002408A4BC|nr:uncharacterized protein LOC131077888 [Cryptomeria japonica]GLJ19402.1 hypothetical protein SUGI_0349910 [Cryptomeria japonica]
MDRVFSASFSRSCTPFCLPYSARTIAGYSYSCPKFLRRMSDVSWQRPIHCGYSQNKDSSLPVLKEVRATDLSLRASNLRETPVRGNVIRRGQAFKQLIILDLNGVLVRTYPRQQIINVPKGPSMLLRYKQIYFRPKLSHFIDKCLDSFEIGIWSCLRMDNIKIILRKSLGEKRMDRLLFIWDQSWCTVQGHENTPYGNIRPIFLKDLSSVWQAYPQYGPENTLFIDDSEYKLKTNQNLKYVCPKTYDPEDKEIDQSPFFLWNTIIDHMDECKHITGDDHNMIRTDQAHV